MKAVVLYFVDDSDADDFAEDCRKRRGQSAGQMLEVIGLQACRAVNVRTADVKKRRSATEHAGNHLASKV